MQQIEEQLCRSLLEKEKKQCLIMKVLLMVVGLVVGYVYRGQPHLAQTIPLTHVTVGYGLLTLAYTYLVRHRGTPGNIRLLWYLSFILDITYANLLVVRSGGLSSPVVIIYSLIMLRIARSVPNIKQGLIIGLISFVLNVATFLYFDPSLAFLQDREYWFGMLLLWATFLGTVVVVVRTMWAVAREREKLASELEQLSYRDGLTNLYNRRYFQAKLKELELRCKESSEPLSLVMLDIDYFKVYNDTYGHQEGDHLLVEIGRLLKRTVRKNDLAFRYGGEEFAVLLPDTLPEAGFLIAERIREAVEQFPFPGFEKQPGGKVTVSCGVATMPQHARDAEDLVRKADRVLYRAKETGRNRTLLYSTQEEERDTQREPVELFPILDSIETLLSVLRARDPYICHHSIRVEKYAAAVAERLGLGEKEIFHLRVAALLHDLGKVKLNQATLSRPGRLSAGEWEKMKLHTLWGADVIKCIDGFKPVEAAITYHHERYDGTGYPEGLRGEEIPIEARILAVADSFDAMTTSRPYQPAKKLSEAIDELKRNAGTQFDPRVVKALIETIGTSRTFDRYVAATRSV